MTKINVYWCASYSLPRAKNGDYRVTTDKGISNVIVNDKQKYLEACEDYDTRQKFYSTLLSSINNHYLKKYELGTTINEYPFAYSSFCEEDDDTSFKPFDKADFII